jgi:hypothetical protein
VNPSSEGVVPQDRGQPPVPAAGAIGGTSRGGRREVEHVQQCVAVRVPRGQRRQAEHHLDEARDRRVLWTTCETKWGFA